MKDDSYWERVREKARQLKSDGCSGVPDIYVDCCYEHDIAYRTGATVDGYPQLREEADRKFRRCIQSKSFLGIFSPMSWWRWLGVRLGGKASYHASK